MAMQTSVVDDFSTRLAQELNALGWLERNELLIRIGRQELRMRSDGQERPVWRGLAPVTHMLGADVVVQTDHGEQRGRVICFGVINTGPEYERSVVVHVPASGTCHEVPGSQARLASPEDSIRIRNEVAMAARLVETEAKALLEGPPARRSARGLRDPGLIDEFLVLARNSSNVSRIDEAGSNHKVTGTDPSRRLYVFKSQLRVDVSGYSFDHPGLRHISDDEARDMHLGKVRGQVIFGDRAVALSAFTMALQEMGSK